MYAIVQDGSKQYRIEKGQEVLVDRKTLKEGEKVEFPCVLVYSDGESVKVGSPYVKGIKITGEVVGEIKDKKLRVFKYRRREGFHKTIGHRQKYTRVRIMEIAAG